MERLSVESHVLHRACFKCSTCGIQLKMGSYESDKNADKFYCKTHYREALRQQTLKRTMEARGITSFEEKDKDGGTARKRKKKFPSPEPEPAEPSVSMEVGAPGSPTVSAATSGPKPAAPVSRETPIAEQQPSQISRQDSEKLRSNLPSLLKTLAATKQKDTQSKRLSPPPPPSHSFVGSLSAGSSPVSTPLSERKADKPSADTRLSPLRTEVQHDKKVVVTSAKVNELPKSSPVARATTTEAPSSPANVQPDTKGLPKSTVSWLTKGAKVIPKTEPTPRPLPRTSAPERVKPSRPLPPSVPPPSSSKTAATTSVAGGPPPPPITKQVSTPVLRFNTQAVRNQDASKTAPVPSRPEIPKPAKKDDTENSVSFEPSVSTSPGAPVKPPRTKSKKHPSPDKPKDAEKPLEVRKPQEQPPAKDAKPEERPTERKPEDKPPVRQSIRPKRPAPPRPSHAPSIRKAGHSPSRRLPPVGKGECVSECVSVHVCVSECVCVECECECVCVCGGGGGWVECM